MYTLDEFIARLIDLKTEVGGDVPVMVSDGDSDIEPAEVQWVEATELSTWLLAGQKMIYVF